MPSSKPGRRPTFTRDGTPGERDAARALRALERSMEATRAGLVNVAAVLERLAATAVDARLAELAASLMGEHLLRDLDLFAPALASDEPLSRQQRQSLARLHHALAAWMQDCLELEPDREVGRHIDVPRSRLCRFDIDGGPPGVASEIVTLRIEARGWRRKGSTLCLPLASIVSAP